MIAFEDVGVGDVDTVVLTIAGLKGKTHRAEWAGNAGATEPILTDEEFARIRSYQAEWDMTPIYADGPESGWY